MGVSAIFGIPDKDFVVGDMYHILLIDVIVEDNGHSHAGAEGT